ncbi:hypothetical protein JKF63_04790 [Porcisia hertigi]|uniref:Uncharacterized protein n=1 Tax=Porcisia hertigi TaxID=2761500 RepID=A0A836IRP5_9TRYP|nr:hypothetical protein JKF63_04790 [Porcisia hertigi]
MLSSTMPVALVTGSAKRLGAGIAVALHTEGYAVCLQYNHSAAEAAALAEALNEKRPNSAIVIQADLRNTSVSSNGGTDDLAVVPLSKCCASLVDACYTHWGRCDVLVNNASAYYPTPLLRGDGEGRNSCFQGAGAAEAAADDIFGSNAMAPYYLIKTFAQRVADTPTERRGGNYSIVNMVDAMTRQPLLGFTMYSMAKGALESLTRCAALELAPLHIRVNGVGPGLSVLGDDMPSDIREDYRKKVPLYQREATITEVSDIVIFLCSSKARYVTGASLNVDGGYSLTRA